MNLDSNLRLRERGRGGDAGDLKDPCLIIAYLHKEAFHLRAQHDILRRARRLVHQLLRRVDAEDTGCLRVHALHLVKGRLLR